MIENSYHESEKVTLFIWYLKRLHMQSFKRDIWNLIHIKRFYEYSNIKIEFNILSYSFIVESNLYNLILGMNFKFYRSKQVNCTYDLVVLHLVFLVVVFF